MRDELLHYIGELLMVLLVAAGPCALLLMWVSE